MEAAKIVDVTERPNIMERGRLAKALIMTVQIIVSLVMWIIVLPFFVLWRVPISLLYLTKKEKEKPENQYEERENVEARADKDEREEEEPNPPPPKDAHERAIDRFTETWVKFRDYPVNRPLVKYWSRIVCCLFLIIQTSLSLALLEKSLVYHIPWFVAHLSNTQYKATKKEEWWNDFLVHVAGLTITCAPFMGLIGVGVALMYYTLKAVKYGKFKKGAVKKKGGRGYDNPKEKSEDGNGEGHGVKEAIMGVVDHVIHPHAGHAPVQRHPEDSLYGYSGCSEDVLFEQPGDRPYGCHDVLQPPLVAIQPPKKTAWYDKNPYTLAGIASIWTGKEETMKTGYDGRDVRRRNFEEDIEMANRAGKK